MMARNGEIAAAGIHEVVLFHSTPQEVEAYASDLPFDVVADPDKQLYEEFGVESSLRSVVDPRAAAPVVKALLRRDTDFGTFTGAPMHPTGGTRWASGGHIVRPGGGGPRLQIRNPR